MNSIRLPIQTRVHVKKLFNVINTVHLVLCEMKYTSILFKTLGCMTNLLFGLLLYVHTCVCHFVLRLNSSWFRFSLQKLQTNIKFIWSLLNLILYQGNCGTLISFKKRLLLSIWIWSWHLGLNQKTGIDL